MPAAKPHLTLFKKLKDLNLKVNIIFKQKKYAIWPP